MRRFRALAAQIGVKEVFAVATAAAREAKNGDEFVDRAETALGVHINVLSGKEEARYAALGLSRRHNAMPTVSPAILVAAVSN